MNKSDLNNIENEVIKTLTGEVKNIVDETRKNMVVVEEKSDGDSATIADVKIGQIFENLLPKLLPNSVVVQEESFNQQIHKQFLKSKYVWVVDPIDGTKAFRDTNNFEWCVGICLLENFSPILSLVYIPEPWLEQKLLLSANKFRKGLLNFGVPFNSTQTKHKAIKYVSHIHKDTERNDVEKTIASLFENNETIRAYDGHSTLARFAEVAVNVENRVFTRRGANIWDIVQSAYLVEKSGGKVCYIDGKNIFPLDPKVLEFKDNHLIMPFTVAASKTTMKTIIKSLKNQK